MSRDRRLAGHRTVAPAPRRSTFASNIVAIAYKEAAILRHDKAVISMIVGQPIMMLILMGYVLTNTPSNVPWLVLDRSQSELSRRLVSEIQSTGHFLRPVPVTSYEAGRRRLRGGEATALVVVPKSLRRDVERGRPKVQLLLDGADPLTSARVGGYISQVAAATQTRRPDPGVGSAGGRSLAAPDRSRAPVHLRQRFWFNPTLDEHIFLLSAVAGMLLTNLCLSATSLGLVGERENGTYEQMLSLPTRPIEIILGKLVPHVGLSYLVLLLATVLSGVVFGLWPAGSWIALIIVTLPFVLASLAIGVFVSVVARTSAQAVFITVFFIMPSFVLGGILFPYGLMPSGVREIGGLLPLRWYQISLRRIIERGAGLADVVGPMMMTVLLFAGMLVLIRWRMKPRLE